MGTVSLRGKVVEQTPVNEEKGGTGGAFCVVV